MKVLRALPLAIVSLAVVSAPWFGRWPGIAPNGASPAAASALVDQSGLPAFDAVAADNDNNGNNNNSNNNKNDNNGNNNNGNNNNGNNNNGNDNNGNKNGNDNNGNDDDDRDRRDIEIRRLRRPVESRTGITKCFDVQEVGLVQRSLGDGDVTVSVPPDAGFSSITRLTLRTMDLPSLPAPSSGALLGSLVWSLDAQGGCAGPPIVQLPGAVNLGITYRVPADKAKLQIVYLQGGQWTNVPTVPDPAAGNPYISATISNGGIYAVVQLP